MRWSRAEVEAEPIAAPGSRPEAGINKQGNRVIQTVLPAISRMSVRIRPRALERPFVRKANGRAKEKPCQAICLTLGSTSTLRRSSVSLLTRLTNEAPGLE